MLKLLNLGCGGKTSDKPGVINIDWSIYLRVKRNKVLHPFVPLVLRGKRLEKFNSIPDNIMVYNLAKGIPFETGSVDVVYHSHMLEHLDRDIAEQFLLEVRRVLKPGGIHRISVPDMEKLCKEYLEHIVFCETNPDAAAAHDSSIDPILEQCVRREAYGARQQTPVRRFIENRIIGDARKRGETHQWMYDRINLKSKLLNAGYKEVIVQKYNTSLIPDWNDYGLDVDKNGNQYKTESLYIEAVK